jgi:TolB-like protein/Flp pilus assembly protein TadD
VAAAIALTLALAGALIGLDLGGWRTRLLARGPGTSIASLAVLPLKNLSADPEQEYFVDGMTEALITNLAKIGALRVISSTSVMQYKGVKKPLPQIARELKVDAVVEGSVQRSGNRARISAQLIEATTDRNLWAESYERELRDVLTLQSDLARAIASEIRIKLTPQEQKLLTRTGAVNPEAHEAYLKGRYHLNRRTEKELKKSTEYFQQAIDRDPNYASGYSGLADAWTLLGLRGSLPLKPTLSRAKAAALKAVELDETLAEAHASVAFIAETYEWDWITAEREFKRALELNPSYAPAHSWYAGYLTYLGRFDEGIAEAKRARDLDPLSLAIINALGGRLLAAHRFDEASEQIRNALELDPNFAQAHNLLAWFYLLKGKHQEALAEFHKELTASGDDPDLASDLGYAYAVAGKRDEAKKILAKLKLKREREFVAPSAIAMVAGALGEKDEAFKWLETAYEERDPNLTYLKVGYRLDPLRSDPRFTELLRRIGLSP